MNTLFKSIFGEIEPRKMPNNYCIGDTGMGTRAFVRNSPICRVASLSEIQKIMCTQLAETQKNEVQIDTAYNSTNSTCAFVDAKIKIEKFSATQSYIISEDIKNHEMILGMDFLGKRIHFILCLNFI